MTDTNPLLSDWTTPFGLPPFDAIQPAHFRPAFDSALAAHEAEIAAIADNPAAPTFDNTITALENAGRLLRKVGAVFWNLTGSHTNDEIQAIEREMSPRLAKHWNTISSNEPLFRRVDALFETRADLALTAEQKRLLERTHLGFVRSGAKLSTADKARNGEIKQRLAALSTRFGQNILADEKSYVLALDKPEDLAGLPDFVVAACRKAAEERGLTGHVVTLARSVIDPFLTFSDRRDLREQAFKAWIARGETGGETDNRAIVAETVALRLESARLLGYETFAAFKLEDTMAKTPEAVAGLLERVWAPARARALVERDRLQAYAAAEGQNITIEPWDWRYYAEKVRRTAYDLDETQVKPYLPLDRLIAAAFATAERLFGLSFREISGLPVYHPDVRVFEVSREGQHVGLFLGDYFARPSKRSGAWMSGYRGQEKLAGDIRPIIVNVMNFAKTGGDAPALLSMDDAHTLFHEFGHALHGLMSDVTYPSLAGTAVSRDFVELPSQLYEHWLDTPEILGEFARRSDTGEPMPAQLMERLHAARTFNQGFATVEFIASAMVDMAFHTLKDATHVDPLAVERATLTKIGMPSEIVMRHRTSHFSHVFSGGYSAGYYSYMWSEVLDADAFAAFEETGNVFDRETARRLATYVYGAGGMRDETEAYLAFRGKMPSVEGLLRKRGLIEAA